MSNTPSTIEYTESSGNVFADLGLPDAEDLQLKSDLLIRIQMILEERALTDDQAAQLMALDAARLTAVRHGRLSDFTITQLFQFLNRLGRRVEVRISPTETDPNDAHTLLVAA